MKKLVKTLIICGSIIGVIGVCVLSSHLVLKYKYNIDSIEVINGLNNINKKVDEDKACSNKFNEEDKEKAIEIINASTNDFIQNDKDNIVLDYDRLVNEMQTVIELNDREVGAICSTYLDNLNNNKFEVGGFTFDVELLELTFNDLKEKSCDLATVFKISVSSFKEQMNSFPLNIAKDMVPNDIYLFSTVTVNKGTSAFEYSLTSTSFKMNACTIKQTSSLFEIVDLAFDIGNSSEINLLIG
ncbi:MAG: hypothetical protein SO106_03835, partial [Candidatus Onthovivens sp.]|nr:hypothetical protein [Candidatus Onthovivens sp.]